MKRTKRRYLSLRIDAQNLLNSTEFMSAVWKNVTKLYGEYGSSRAGLALIEYDEAKRIAVLRTSLDALDITRAALASITRIMGKPAAVHVIMISGTIKALHRHGPSLRE